MKDYTTKSPKKVIQINEKERCNNTSAALSQVRYRKF